MNKILVIAILNIVIIGAVTSAVTSLSSNVTAPVITITGTNQISVQRGSTYTDAGATALDNVDGNITSSIVVSNPVNTSVLGTYTITYDVTDSRGYHAKQITRTVIVTNSEDEYSNNTFVSSSPSESSNFDKWKIKEIYPTKINGREWFSVWDNGISRKITSGNLDPYDPTGWFRIRGDGSGAEIPTLYIDGSGTATMSGYQPRMYVYDSLLNQKWLNTEITVYGKRLSETGHDSAQGINIGARSNHQIQGKSNCNVDTYYSRMLYNGVGNFAKEINWPNDVKTPSSTFRLNWSTIDDTMPHNVWIGHKFVIRNVDGGSHVKLEMWRDLTDGLNGGDWKLMVEYTDKGDWRAPETVGCATSDLNKIILEANPSIFIRNTDISSAEYKYFSAREIEPLP